MISVVIPIYNEEKIICESVKALTEVLARDFGDDYELVLVNDGSTDRTPELIRRLGAEYAHILPCGYEKNRGKGGALTYGVAKTRGDVVLYTDSDLAYGADVIRDFCRAVKENGGGAIGSRALDKDGYAAYTFVRKLASKCYLIVLKLFAGFEYSDSQCGIKCFSGDIARELFAKNGTDGFAFDLEILMRAKKMGVPITEIPVRIINHRDSKIDPVKDAFRMIKDLCAIKSRLKREQ